MTFPLGYPESRCSGRPIAQGYQVQGLCLTSDLSLPVCHTLSAVARHGTLDGGVRREKVRGLEEGTHATTSLGMWHGCGYQTLGHSRSSWPLSFTSRCPPVPLKWPERVNTEQTCVKSCSTLSGGLWQDKGSLCTHTCVLKNMSQGAEEITWEFFRRTRVLSPGPTLGASRNCL